MKRLLPALATALLVSCAATPRPQVMSQADAVEHTPAAAEAQKLAPQAFAHAQKLRQEAEHAYQDDDVSGAQILGEQSIAAYTHAFVLARLAKAGARLDNAQAQLDKAGKSLHALDEKEKRVAAEADDLEMRAKVAQDALPLVPNTPASPAREKARLAAARSMAVEARLLCVSTRLLGQSSKDLQGALSKLDALDTRLSKKPSPAPIDDAIALRSQCLDLLGKARRPATRKAPAAGVTDALLTELSKTGELYPFRDDRGVVVTLRGLFRGGDQLDKPAQKTLGLLGRVAKAHAAFPVLVVVHSASGAPSARDQKRGEAVAKALEAAGAAKVEVQRAGGAEPLVEPARRGAAARNQRIEIVFISPAS